MLPLLRAGLGIILIAHGCQKLFGMFGGMGLNANAALFERLGYKPGMFWGTLVGCTETIGGLMLVFGLFTRLGRARHRHLHDHRGVLHLGQGLLLDGGRHRNISILILLVALVFMIRGGGEYSIDKSMGKEF